MGLPHGQRQLLDAIENELRANDPGLTCVFFAFNSVTRNQSMPRVEQLGNGTD
jgi:hypothetical protein